MSPAAVRLALGMALIPFLPGLCYLAQLTERHFRGTWDNWTEWRAYTLCALVTLVVWLGLWWRGIVWTRGRAVATILLGLLLVSSPASGLLPSGDQLLGSRAAPWWDAFRFTFPFFALAGWIGGTAWTWRQSSARTLQRATWLERDQLARCPKCGYSLKGLREVRCPECGWNSTVDGIIEQSLADVLDTS